MMSDNLNIKLAINGDVSGQEELKAFIKSLYDIADASEKVRQELKKQTTVEIYNETKGKSQADKMVADAKKAVDAASKASKAAADKDVEAQQRASAQRLASQLKTIKQIQNEQSKAASAEERENLRSFNSIFNARIRLQNQMNAKAASEEKKQLREAMRIGLEIENEKERQFLAIVKKRIGAEEAAEEIKERNFLDSVRQRVQAQQALEKQAQEEAARGGFINQMVVKFNLLHEAIRIFRNLLNEAWQIAQQIARTIFDAFVAVGTEGVRMNAEFEGIKYGLTSVINAQLKLADASTGEMLDGIEKYRAATKLAADQFMKIRIEALKVQATTEELAKAYQIAVSVGAGQGIKDLDKILKLTVAITNAATAMNVPMDQVPVTIRAVLTGYQATHNVVARTLGLNMKLINTWRDQGTLVKELEGRLNKFSEAAQVSAKSFNVMSSNIQEAYQVISARVTEGMFASLSTSMNKYFWDLFDFKGSTFSTKYEGFLSVFRGLFDTVGNYFSDTVDKIMEFVDRINKGLSSSPELLAKIRLGFAAIGTAVQEVTDYTIEWLEQFFEAKDLPSLLNNIASGIRKTAKAIEWVIAFMSVLKDMLKWTPMFAFFTVIGKLAEGWDKLESMVLGVKTAGEKAEGALGRVLERTEQIKKASSSGNSSDVGAGKYARNQDETYLDMGTNLNQSLGASVAGVMHPRENKEGSGHGSLTRSRISLIKAEMDAELAIIKEKVKEREKILEDSYKEGLISIDDYYRERRELMDRELDQEIKIKRAEEAEIKSIGTKTAQESLQKQIDLVKVRNELALLYIKKESNYTDLGLKKYQDELKLSKEELSIEKKLAELQGKPQGSNRDIVTAEYEELMKKFTANGNEKATSTLKKLIDAETLKRDLDDLMKKYNAVMTEMSAKEVDLKQKQQMGVISTEIYQEQLVTLHKETADGLQDLIDKMTALANNPLTSPEQQAKIKALIPTVNGLKDAYLETAKTMREQFLGEFTNLFENIRNGSMEAIDSVRNLAKNIVSIIGNLLSQRLGERLFQMLMPSGGSVGAFSTFVGWLMGSSGHAAGGYISGPGTGTSDSIPARLSNGEYVVNAQRTRMLGVPFLDWINGIAGRPSYAFATGGLVIGDSTTSAASGSQEFLHRMDIGFDEGLFLRYLDSPAGTKIMTRKMQQNPRTFNRALGRKK